jgi:hypothetical protein
MTTGSIIAANIEPNPRHDTATEAFDIFIDV